MRPFPEAAVWAQERSVQRRNLEEAEEQPSRRGPAVPEAPSHPSWVSRCLGLPVAGMGRHVPDGRPSLGSSEEETAV